MTIYHIISESDWQLAQEQGIYHPESLDTEGFIHLSTAEQVPGTVERYYAGRTDLLLLHVDESCLSAELRYETTAGRGPYPHLYGELELSAVVRTRPLDPEAPDRAALETS